MKACVALLGQQLALVVLVRTLVVAVKNHVSSLRAGTLKEFHEAPPVIVYEVFLFDTSRGLRHAAICSILQTLRNKGHIQTFISTPSFLALHRECDCSSLLVFRIEILTPTPIIPFSVLGLSFLYLFDLAQPATLSLAQLFSLRIRLIQPSFDPDAKSIFPNCCLT